MRRLMAHALRDRTTPKALAQSRQVIDFKGRLSDFPRLVQIVENDLESLDAAERPTQWDDSPVSATLSFGFADVSETLPTVAGEASVVVPAVCQRCLDVAEVPLTVTLRHLLLPARDSGADVEGYDVWELEEDTFRPSDLVEEALIMALPMSATHQNPDDCGPLAGRLADGKKTGSETTRPFADLRSLMSTKD
jgi:uncharacterized metal-binding protein YceD (DUF177 family)